MTKIDLYCQGAAARAVVDGVITAGMVGIPVNIHCDSSWDGLTKTLVCMSAKDKIPVILGAPTPTVAWEVLVEGFRLYLGLEGRDSTGEIVIPTAWADCGKIKASSEGVHTGKPTPTEMEQLFNIAENIILVQDEQPTVAENKAWVTTKQTEIVVLDENGERKVIRQAAMYIRDPKTGEYKLPVNAITLQTTAEEIAEIQAAGNAETAKSVAAIQKKTEESLNLLPGDIENVQKQYNAIKADVSNLTGNDILQFEDGYYIDTHGSTADVADKKKSTTGLMVAVDACAPGDIYYVTGTGGVNARLWAFVAADGTVISKAASSETEYMRKLTAPDDAAWFVVNLTSDGGSCYKNQIIRDVIGDVEENIQNMTRTIEQAVGVKALSFEKDRYIDTSGDTADINQKEKSPNGFMCAVEECEPRDSFVISGTGGVYARLWAFVAEDGTVLSRASNNKTEKDAIHYAPEETAYIVCNFNSDGGTVTKNRNLKEAFMPQDQIIIDDEQTAYLSDYRKNGIQFVSGASKAQDAPPNCPSGATLINMYYPLGKTNGRTIQILYTLKDRYTAYRTLTRNGTVSVDWIIQSDNQFDRDDWHVFGSSSEAGYYSYFDENGNPQTAKNHPQDMYTYIANSRYYHKNYYLHAHGSQGFVARNSAVNRNGIEELATVASIAPHSLITVHYGAADYSLGNALTLGSMESPLGDGTFYGNCRKFFEDLIAKAPDSTIIMFIKFFKVENKSTEQTHYSLHYAKGQYTWNDLVIAIKEICDYYGIPYIDWSKGTGFFNVKNAREAMPDGKHLTKELNELSAKMLIGSMMYY